MCLVAGRRGRAGESRLTVAVHAGPVHRLVNVLISAAYNDRLPSGPMVYNDRLALETCREAKVGVGRVARLA